MSIGFDATAVPKHPAGAGNYILQLARALVELETGSHELVIFIQQHGMELLAAGGTLPNDLEWVVLPDRRPGLRLAWEQIGLPWLVRKFRLDLLHSPHYTMPWLLPFMARKVKTVVTFHDMTFFLFPHLHTRVKRWFFPLAIRLSAARADRLIACSESTRQDAIRLLHLPGKKIASVYLGISPDFKPIKDQELLDSIREKYHLPKNFFLYVGTVEPRKNLPLLLQSYARTNSRWPLVIVGQKGWHYKEVFQMVDQLQLQDSVTFTGYVPAAELPVLYNLGSIFVYPSLYEGAGLPPLEALACGTPVITTAVSSMPEYTGEAAVLVPPGDLEALAQAMQELSQDPARLAEMVKNGPTQATGFTWKRTAQDTLAIYYESLQT